MSDYVRPALPDEEFYDSAGVVIQYGSRWRRESPPEDTYSVVSHPERFASLHVVANALVGHLAANYAVSVTEDVSFADDLVHGRTDALRAVRVTPVNANEAPLTFVFTPFPGVIVHAGVLHDFPFPGCGCDACDESGENAIDELEGTVLAVVAGRYFEWVDERGSLPLGYRIAWADGTSSQGSQAGFTPDTIRQAIERLGALPNGWQPWTRKDSDLS
ncbi:MAG TPA: DUF6226 family protein [Dehalococcoidia bacterium]|nr:DUF6226 family protein [Dehalococcoidia bacterium]